MKLKLNTFTLLSKNRLNFLAVPVSQLHPKSLLQYYASDSSSKLFITVPKFSDLMQQVARNSSTRLHVLDDKLKLNCTLMQVSVLVTL